MPDQPSLVIVKRGSYRGSPEEWSNKYHFSGTIPTSAVEWKALADAWIQLEKPTMHTSVSFVRAYGYEPGSDRKGGHADFVLDYTAAPNTPVVGTNTGFAGQLMPGDVAATVRWSTPDFNARGKRIYCRKYLHCVFQNPAVPDQIQPSVLTLYNTYAAACIAGSLPGSAKYCGPQGAVLSAPIASPYLTTRTLKRRGKRPPLAGTP